MLSLEELEARRQAQVDALTRIANALERIATATERNNPFSTVRMNDLDDPGTATYILPDYFTCSTCGAKVRLGDMHTCPADPLDVAEEG